MLRIRIIQILSLPKTVWFCLRVFPLKTAIKLPVQVAYNVRLKKLRRGGMKINGDVRPFQVKIGLGGVAKIPARKTLVFLEKGTITFHGGAILAEGTILSNEGNLEFGDNFYANVNCTIWCAERISFGRDCLLGWNVTVRDSDGHYVMENGDVKPRNKGIAFGQHCWVCSECSVLKGSGAGNDCIIGFGSILTKTFHINNALIAGSPAKIRKENINWIR